MLKYFDTISEELNTYFHILSPEIPEFIYDYVEAPEMRRLGGIGISCGTDYSKLFNNRIFYTRLDHSVGVSLIIWNFTKSKKQALAGLFHDIANPAFSHCIDFFHGDYEKQESTEEPTTQIIANSTYIMERLKRDNITLDEVKDYKLYPIADNETPRVSADRLEYTFSNGFSMKDIWKEGDIKKIYNNISILKNEDGIEEIGFKNLDIAEYFVNNIKVLWFEWISHKDRFLMQAIADILKLMVEENLLTENDFYKYSEYEILDKAKKCGIARIENAVNNFQNATEVFESNIPKEGVYNINCVGKHRYIDPLVEKDNTVYRLSELSSKIKNNIEQYLAYDMSKYIYSNFDI